MRAKLLSIYDENRSMREQLQRGLDEELQRADNSKGVERALGRRRTYARRLQRWLDWADLRNQFAPHEFQVKRPVDPEIVIAESVEYCRGKGRRRQKVQELVTKWFQEVKIEGDELARSMHEELDEDLKDSSGGHLFVRIRFLVLMCGMTPTLLKKEGLLDPNSKIWQRLNLVPETDDQEAPPEPPNAQQARAASRDTTQAEEKAKAAQADQ